MKTNKVNACESNHLFVGWCLCCFCCCPRTTDHQTQSKPIEFLFFELVWIFISFILFSFFFLTMFANSKKKRRSIGCLVVVCMFIVIGARLCCYFFMVVVLFVCFNFCLIVLYLENNYFVNCVWTRAREYVYSGIVHNYISDLAGWSHSAHGIFFIGCYMIVSLVYFIFLSSFSWDEIIRFIASTMITTTTTKTTATRGGRWRWKIQIYRCKCWFSLRILINVWKFNDFSFRQ